MIIISQWGKIIFEKAFFLSTVFLRDISSILLKLKNDFFHIMLKLFQPIVYLLQKKIVYRDLFPD